MLKTIGLLGKPASNKNNGSMSASNKNNNSKLASIKNDSNSEVNWFDVRRNSVKHTKMSGKLSKLGKSKSKKTSKS